jgi:very-short-patch-repair endonuclease
MAVSPGSQSIHDSNIQEVARAKPVTERGSAGTPSRSRRKEGTTVFARQLRHGDNMAEALIWDELKAKKLGGHKFVRQFPIGPYFADFLFRKQRLVIETDGSQHAGSKTDRVRDDYMQQQGYSILRFWSHDVLKSRTAIIETILAALEGRLSESVVALDMRFVYAKRHLNPEP